QYKKLTGIDYKPTNASATVQKENKKPAAASAPTASNEAENLAEQITQQGEKVRELKTNKSTSK
ncbi:unnamed protein product, partial [Rotaria socialis]